MRQNFLSPEQAAKIAQQAVGGGGRIIDIDLDRKNIGSGWIYDIEVIKNGLEYEVYVDAISGNVLKVKKD